MSKSKLTRSTNRRGVTLLELLLVIGMSAIILSILGILFETTFETYNYSTTSGNLQLTTRTALDRMTREMRQGVSIVDSNGAYTTDANQIVVQMPAIDASNNIVQSTYDYLIYRRNPANTSELQEIMEADSLSARRDDTRVILRDLTAANFTYYNMSNAAITSTYTDTKRVKIQLNVNQNKYGKDISVSYTQYATLRNK